MAIEAKAKIEIKGGSQALRTIQGVDRAGQKAAANSKKAAAEQARAVREQERAAKSAARAQENATRAATRAQERASAEAQRAAKRAADAKIRETQRAEREVMRAADREARRWQRLAQESARYREQAEQRTQRTRDAFAGRALRSGVRFMGAATAGVVAGGVSAVNTARGIAGVQDVGERIRRANDFRESLIITSRQAGVSAERREQIQSSVLSAAEKSAIDPVELAGALEVAQKSFNAFESFGSIINELAVTAKAGGANVGELTSALGFVKQAFGLTEDQTVEALNLMVAAAAKGSVEVGDFARDFAAVSGIFASKTGQTGLEGVRQFLGVSQATATGGFGSAESATRVERFAGDLRDKHVLSGLRGIGVKPIGKDGKIDVGSVLDQLAGNKQFKSATKRQEIFREERSLQAVEALLAARARVASGKDPNAIDFRTIAGVDAAEGARLTTGTFQELEKSGALDMQREAIKLQNDAITNLKSFNEQILKVVKASSDLERSLGTWSVWLPSLGVGAATAAGTAALGALASGGNAAAAGKAAATLGGMAATGAGLATMAVGALGAGATGYYGARALGAEKLGERIGGGLADIFVGPRPERASTQGMGVDFGKLDRSSAPRSAGPTAVAAPRVEQLLQQQNQDTRELVRKTDALVNELSRRPAPRTNTDVRSAR